MIEQHLLEIATSTLDEQANVSLLLIGEKWLFNITILSLKYDCIKYTYYEISKDKKTKRLVQRITPFEKVDEILITFNSDKNTHDLEKDLSLKYTAPISSTSISSNLDIELDTPLDIELDTPLDIELDTPLDIELEQNEE